METKSQDSIQDDLKDLLKRCPAGTYEAALAFRQDKDVDLSNSQASFSFVWGKVLEYNRSAASPHPKHEAIWDSAKFVIV